MNLSELEKYIVDDALAYARLAASQGDMFEPKLTWRQYCKLLDESLELVLDACKGGRRRNPSE
jgi:hypothetical protein